MKPGRIFALIVVLALTLALAGCKGSYFFSFKVEQDLENEDGAWYAVGEEDDEYNFQEEGANFRNSCFTAPLRFSGDFTMTVRFRLIADLTHMYNFGIVLSDGYYYEPHPQNKLTFEVYNGGGTDSYSVKDGNDDGLTMHHVNEITLIPGLVYDGDNTFVLTKIGDIIRMVINDVEAADFEIYNYNSRWFIPTVFAYTLDIHNPTYGLTLESVEVEYDGTSSKAPVPPAQQP